MYDLTAVLLGDPQAAKRRPPTPEEMNHHKGGIQPGPWAQMEIGDFMLVNTWAKATSAQSYWRARDGKVRTRLIEGGIYRLERLA